MASGVIRAVMLLLRIACVVLRDLVVLIAVVCLLILGAAISRD